jgi:hypothetical protein
MKKKIVVISIFFMLICSLIVFIVAQNESSPDSIEQISDSDTALTTTETPSSDNISNDLNNETEFNVNPGMTPDSPIYFIKDTYQRIVVGNDPEKALSYREQKIAEAKAMVEKGKPGATEKSLDRALQYGNIVEREVSPDIQDKVNESMGKVQDAINDMKQDTIGEQWNDVNAGFDKNIEQGKKVETAAEISAKIKELCETLAKLDPLQYADSCKPKDNSPNWIKTQDKQAFPMF